MSCLKHTKTIVWIIEEGEFDGIYSEVVVIELSTSIEMLIDSLFSSDSGDFESWIVCVWCLVFGITFWTFILLLLWEMSNGFSEKKTINIKSENEYVKWNLNDAKEMRFSFELQRIHFKKGWQKFGFLFPHPLPFFSFFSLFDQTNKFRKKMLKRNGDFCSIVMQIAVYCET